MRSQPDASGEHGGRQARQPEGTSKKRKDRVRICILSMSPATFSISILYIRPLQFSLKDFIIYISFFSKNVL
jgi:hypothetical protein